MYWLVKAREDGGDQVKIKYQYWKFEEADDESSGGRNQETARDGWGGRELRALYLLSVVGGQFCTSVLVYLHCRGGGELSEEEERDGWSRGHQGAYRVMHSSDTVEPTVT